MIYDDGVDVAMEKVFVGLIFDFCLAEIYVDRVRKDEVTA